MLLNVTRHTFRATAHCAGLSKPQTPAARVGAMLFENTLAEVARKHKEILMKSPGTPEVGQPIHERRLRGWTKA